MFPFKRKSSTFQYDLKYTFAYFIPKRLLNSFYIHKSSMQTYISGQKRDSNEILSLVSSWIFNICALGDLKCCFDCVLVNVFYFNKIWWNVFHFFLKSPLTRRFFCRSNLIKRKRIFFKLVILKFLICTEKRHRQWKKMWFIVLITF